MPAKTDILIISDTHLGSAASSSKDLIDLLNSIDCKKLIILGDLFDHPFISKLKKKDWDFLAYLEAKAGRGEEILWIKGNHDRYFPHDLPHLAAVPIMEECSFEIAGKKYIAIHGDQFDQYIKGQSPIVHLGDAFNNFITRFNLKRKVVMNTIGRLYGMLLGLSRVVANGALAYAKEKDADYIICGHTHRRITKTTSDKGRKIMYLNSGSWTQTPASYITIDEKGPHLRIYKRS